MGVCCVSAPASDADAWPMHDSDKPSKPSIYDDIIRLAQQQKAVESAVTREAQLSADGAIVVPMCALGAMAKTLPSSLWLADVLPAADFVGFMDDMDEVIMHWKETEAKNLKLIEKTQSQMEQQKINQTTLAAMNGVDVMLQSFNDTLLKPRGCQAFNALTDAACIRIERTTKQTTASEKPPAYVTTERPPPYTS